jgi:hypothetical protein
MPSYPGAGLSFLIIAFVDPCYGYLSTIEPLFHEYLNRDPGKSTKKISIVWM